MPSATFMKIGIDTSETTGEKTGVGYYTTHLVEALASIDSVNEYTLYPVFFDNFPPTYSKATCPSQDNFALFGRNISRRKLTHLWHKSGMPKEKIFGPQDVFHSTTFSAPELTESALVVTLYDLSFWTHPQCHRPVNRRYCAERCCLAARRAQRLIAISEATKRDILKYLHVPEERVVVTPLAAHWRFKPVEDNWQRHETLMKYGLLTDYIFSLGSLEPRKNLATLIRAYSTLPDRMRRTLQLAIAGAKGWKNSSLFSLIQELGLGDCVRILGYVPDDDLPALYGSASVFVYPSLYEGFGLPALEAMASGAPVIASNTSSLPEVVGTAGIQIDPGNVEALAQAILRVVAQPGLAEELRRKGLEQARRFSWRRTAEQTLQAYSEAVRVKRSSTSALRNG